jgi:hypothetical protein
MPFQGFRKDYALTPAQKADAREALAILDGTGVALAEAARRAVQGRRALRRIKLVDARDEFVRSRLQAGRRARTVEYYEDKLSLPIVKFGERWFDDVTRAEFFGWINKLDAAEGTRAGIVRACRALWRWGMAQEPQLVAVDITAGLNGTGPSNEGDAEFLTVEEVAAILREAGPYRSALALMFFAGVRPEEVAGRSKPPLLWKHVRIEQKIIRIPAEIAKSGKARIIEALPETVWAWLEPADDENQPVSPARTRQAIERATAAVRKLRKDPSWEWPGDATRHTFATYFFALEIDAGKVSAWLGHEGKPQTFHRHYRGLATRAQGEKYEALRRAA